MIRRFNRYELKYVVTARQRDALLPELLAQMRPDDEGEQGQYTVTSLYYDTVDLACYRAKLDGINYRRKLRIRRYGEAPATPGLKVMVEIKQRINRTTQKRRLALPLGEALALCSANFDRPLDDPRDAEVAEEVLFLAGARQLGPKCVIAYRRQALVGSRFEPGLRVTFDRELRVSEPRVGLRGGFQGQRFLPADRLILEVKSNDLIPLWLSRLLAAHSATLKRYSKYCSGLARLRQLHPAIRSALGEEEWTS